MLKGMSLRYKRTLKHRCALNFSQGIRHPLAKYPRHRAFNTWYSAFINIALAINHEWIQSPSPPPPSSPQPRAWPQPYPGQWRILEVRPHSPSSRCCQDAEKSLVPLLRLCLTLNGSSPAKSRSASTSRRTCPGSMLIPQPMVS